MSRTGDSGKKTALRFLPVLVALLFCACAGPVEVGPGLPKTVKGFSEALRWRDFQTAALYLQPHAREVFLAAFSRDDEDLHIVDSRILKVDLHDGEGWAEADYQMEYYRLPSSQVKKWRWRQRWVLVREKMTKPGYWLIENPPPALPWNQ